MICFPLSVAILYLLHLLHVHATLHRNEMQPDPWSARDGGEAGPRGASRRDQSDLASSAARLLVSEGAASTRRSATRRSTARRSAARRSAGGAGVANSITACTPDAPTSLRAARPVSAKRSRSAMLTRLITGESK